LAGAIDLIGQHDVGEQRSAHRDEFAAALIEDARADDVAGQQVGRELDALEVTADRGRERAAGQRLGNAGHPLEQHVSVGQQRHHQRVDDLGLTDDGLRERVAHRLRCAHGRSSPVCT
jgi:hypothetical protein